MSRARTDRSFSNVTFAGQNVPTRANTSAPSRRSVPVAGRWGRRDRVERAAEPALVARLQAAVPPRALQEGVDEAHEVRLVAAHADAVRRVVQGPPDDLGLRVLRREPGEDDVVARHRGDPARL